MASAFCPVMQNPFFSLPDRAEPPNQLSPIRNFSDYGLDCFKNRNQIKSMRQHIAHDNPICTSSLVFDFYGNSKLFSCSQSEFIYFKCCCDLMAIKRGKNQKQNNKWCRPENLAVRNCL